MKAKKTAKKPGPLPGKAVRGSRSGRPIMALLDLLGRRWGLRVVWELRTQPASFRELRERCGGLSPSVLNARLAELRAAGIVERRAGDGYALTEHGDALVHALEPMQTWAVGWARRQSVAPR